MGQTLPVESSAPKGYLVSIFGTRYFRFCSGVMRYCVLIVC